MAASSSHSDSHSSYDDYDDFGLGAGGGGGGGSKQSNARVKKQVETRGGSHGSGTILHEACTVDRGTEGSW